MNVAVILAGGSGTRLGSEVPKQFILVEGKQVIEHTLDVFENCKKIDEICVVCRQDCIVHVKQTVERGGYSKVKKILPGGKERYDSSLAAIKAYNDDSVNLLFHDAVRPLVTERIIIDCIESLEQHDAVATGVMTTDTIWEVRNGECISAIPDRRLLRNAQTPQCFKRGIIRKAYEMALADPMFSTTDDCGIVMRYMPKVQIFVVSGESSNIKITYAEDLLFLQRMLEARKN